MASVNPFDYVNSINYTKKDVMVDDYMEDQYNPFIVNRSLSYFPDTVLYANEMNVNHHLDNAPQYYFLINIVRKQKRFSKWHKADAEQNIEVIREYYGYTYEKATQVLSLLNDDQIKEITIKVNKGGRQ